MNCKAYDIQIMRTGGKCDYCLNGLCQTVNRSEPETTRVLCTSESVEGFKKENPDFMVAVFVFAGSEESLHLQQLLSLTFYSLLSTIILFKREIYFLYILNLYSYLYCYISIFIIYT